MSWKTTEKLEKFLEFTNVDLDKISLLEAVGIASSLVNGAGYSIDLSGTDSLNQEFAPLLDNTYGGLRYLQYTIKHMINCLTNEESKEFHISTTAEYVLTEKDGAVSLSIKYEGVVEAILVAVGIAFVGVSVSDIKTCATCGKVFVQRTKKNRVYCSNRCSSRAVSKKRYADLKNKD